MKLTLKENVNAKSIVLKHEILLQASGLLVGREGVLKTEKQFYLIMAMVDNFIQEDLIALCNEDERELRQIMIEDIEPLFLSIVENEENYNLYKEVEIMLLDRCKEIWDEQHSLIGLVDALLTSISSITDEDKKEVLTATGKIAEQAFDRRTEAMEAKLDKANDKLANFVRNFQEQIKDNKDEVKEESSAE